MKNKTEVVYNQELPEIQYSKKEYTGEMVAKEQWIKVKGKSIEETRKHFEEIRKEMIH